MCASTPHQLFSIHTSKLHILLEHKERLKKSKKKRKMKIEVKTLPTSRKRGHPEPKNCEEWDQWGPRGCLAVPHCCSLMMTIVYAFLKTNWTSGARELVSILNRRCMKFESKLAAFWEARPRGGSSFIICNDHWVFSICSTVTVFPPRCPPVLLSSADQNTHFNVQSSSNRSSYTVLHAQNWVGARAKTHSSCVHE